MKGNRNEDINSPGLSFEEKLSIIKANNGAYHKTIKGLIEEENQEYLMKRNNLVNEITEICTDLCSDDYKMK